MQTRFDGPIYVALHPSRILRIANLAIHAVAVAVISVLAVYRPWLWICVPVLLLLTWMGERHFSMRTHNVPIGFYWEIDHQMRLQSRDGQWRQGECVGAKSLTAFWVRLRFRQPGYLVPRELFIPLDAVKFDVHRRLRARCRVSPPARRK